MEHQAHSDTALREKARAFLPGGASEMPAPTS